MKRREFIEKTTFSTTGILLAGPAFNKLNIRSNKKNYSGIRDINEKMAIAMWDFSWLLRHYKYGGFENWSKALGDLRERGYNAIRIDCFPHLIAADSNGNNRQTFYHPKNNWTPALWGNQYSIYSTPRKSLIEFLSLCNKSGIHIGLATWFTSDESHRNLDIKGLGGFVRVWDETLAYIDSKGLLDNILYVDLINEYPLWHGFEWLKDRLGSMKGQNEREQENVNVHIQNPGTGKTGRRKYNEEQIRFYNNFITDAIGQLKIKWPGLDFFASQTFSDDVPWEDQDFSAFAALDSHIWFVHNPDFGSSTGYFAKIHSCENDMGFEATYKSMKSYWKDHKQELIAWMDSEIEKRAQIARKHNLVCGNTEGWGAISWYEHPALDWDFIKESAEICVDLSLKHGFKFICTSNFTHPHFASLWADMSWHRKITDKIRNG